MMKQPQSKVNNLFAKTTLIFSFLLVIVCCLAIYFSIHDKKNSIDNTMDTILTNSGQEFENITSNFLQAYLPLYELTEEENAILLSYYTSSDELLPQEKKILTNIMKKMQLRDNRIHWIAMYSVDRDINYILYSEQSSINVLPDDFAYIENFKNKTDRMEIYGMKHVSNASYTNTTFSISGGAPYGSQNNCIFIGYKTASLGENVSLFPASVSSMQYYILSDDQIVYDSTGQYDISSLYLPSGNMSGIRSLQGERKYIKALEVTNSSSYIVCMMDFTDLLLFINHHTPLLLLIFICFFAFSAFISKSIQAQVAKEVTVIKDGLHILADNHLEYRLPTEFQQSGFPEIAENINAMSSKLNESIQKAYYFELKQKDAQIAELQATFNPHFLYNTLEMLRSKSYDSGDINTASLIANLASIFRSFIGAKTFIPIKEELSNSRRYLTLLIARYGDKVDFQYDIDSELLHYGIIRNVFQLLIENYFVHGFDASREDGHIYISGHAIDAENIEFQVIDNGYGMSEESLAKLNQEITGPIRHNKESFGLKNLNQRLKLFYGPDYGLTISGNENGGLTISIIIKKMTVEEYEERQVSH